MNRSALLCFMFLIILLLANVADERRDQTSIKDTLDRRILERDTLANQTFHSNETIIFPQELQTQLDSLLDWAHSNPPAVFYQNVTGLFRGNWRFENFTSLLPDNKTLTDDARGKFGWSEGGSYTLNLRSSETGVEDVNYIEGHLRIKDADRSDSDVLLITEGVHFLSNGTLYLFSVPKSHYGNNKTLGYNDLLHVFPNNASFTAAQTAILYKLNEKIEKLKGMLNQGTEHVDDSEPRLSVATECDFYFVMQLHPVPEGITREQMIELEKEMQDPQGISTIRAPPLEATFYQYSKNCSLVLSGRDAFGMKLEKFYAKGVNYAAMASILSLVQIFLLIHQMEYTPTPSSVSKVSYWTIAMQALMDAYLCLLHLTTGVVINSVFIPFSSASFFTFVLASIFGMRYLLVIWRIQRPEQMSYSAARAESNSGAAGAESEGGNGARPTTLPTATTPPDDPRRDASMIYSRFFITMVLGFFIFSMATTRSAAVQNVVIATISFALFSFWIPQIFRNVARGSCRGLSSYYVWGMSVTRLAFPLYFYGCPYNVMGYDPTLWVWILVVYVLAQVLMLQAQEAFGPRFFVPEKYLPPTYNYHPILPSQDDVEASGAGARGDCAICMTPVEIESIGAVAGGVLTGRMGYMVTPCHHLFHTECLERWMRIKLECPVCRSFLPT
ncbi:uncharacterized protein VTP21DRAFT_7609 [Calcarisporiella thermophila]|uniref:uncharacterized protein n=1 Tax=Calcarisporiella thermophila TaxID=911321 RepID=UPI0037429F36